ncbi:MAG: hypothetical protein J3K34DRAFT_484296 [Monoraphidium minutum]|nr:MAG: hypothetical protein J3K34DRAFT_484296 [Monoraphidium minutum]
MLGAQQPRPTTSYNQRAQARCQLVPARGPSGRPGAGAMGGSGADAPPRRARCVFCDLRKQHPDRILYQDEEVFALYDRAPAARLHLLVCPTRHVPNTRSLAGAADARLVAHMREVGERLLSEEQARLGLRDAGAGADGAAARRRVPCCGCLDRARLRLFGGGGAAAAAARGPLLAGAAEDPGVEPPALGDVEEAGSGGGGGRLFGFHKPPWRSVDHLHMHCFLLPLRPRVAWKYKLSLNWVTADDLERQLRR